ncbi:MAG: alpha-amylase family glycosyl hydrolase, partial [Nitrospirota bacterium]
MKIPVATYRLQFHPGFTFEQARRITGYLSALGVSDIYASPVFQARPGSLHGYDIVDQGRINDELGGDAALRALIEQTRRDRLGWLQDIVPNHMAYDGGNRMLMDLFEHGPASAHAGFFDIDWDHPDEGLRGRLLAPFLDRLYRDALIDGAMQLRYDERGYSIQYAAFRFPLKIESYATVLAPGLPAIEERLGAEHPDYVKLLGAVHTVKRLSPAEAPRERAEQAGF